MTDDPLSSVRVELDSSGSTTGFEPTVPSPESDDGPSRGLHRRALLTAIGAVLVVVVVAVVLLGADDGQIAAGVDCGPNVTQTSTTSSLDEEVSSPAGVERLTTISDLRSVVCDDEGYLALTISKSTDSAGLFRSTDGLEWVALDGVTIDGTRVGSVDFVVDGEFGVDRFFGLTRTAAGYSMFFAPVMNGFDAPDTRRLISNDAISWVVDNDFPVEAAIDGRGATQPVNGEFALLTTFDGFENTMVRDLLVTQLSDPTRLPELVCFANRGSNGQGPSLELDLCDGDLLTVAAGDLVAPERMEQVFECAFRLGFVSNPTGYAIYDRESNSSRAVSVPGRSISLPGLFADGSVGALDISHSLFASNVLREDEDLLASCEGLVELAIPETDLVVYSTPDGLERSVELPVEIFDLDAITGTGFATTLDREFVVLFGTAVWAFDVDSMLWRQLAIDLPAFFDIEFVQVVPISGQPGRLAWFGNSQIGVIDLEEETAVVENREFPASFVDVIHADETYMFVLRGSSVARIEMPTQN